jgi:hypothetical protein
MFGWKKVIQVLDEILFVYLDQITSILELQNEIIDIQLQRHVLLIFPYLITADNNDLQ